MKNIKILLLLILLMPIGVYAKKGCCSSHGGEAGCASDGRRICADGTMSPTCTCTPEKVDVYGCTDSNASNYNPNATINNGTCVYDVLGCMDKSAINYNVRATRDDGSCKYDVLGCTDKEAKNYNEKATKDDNSCEYYVLGCMDSTANNYNKDADKDDGSCKYDIKGCMDSSAENYNKNATVDEGSCSYSTEDEATTGEIIGGILTVGLAVGGYQAIKKSKKK